jgi:hypothetical protein
MIGVAHVLPCGQIFVRLIVAEAPAAPVLEIEHLPAQLSMHISLLKEFGGSLDTLYDMERDLYEGASRRPRHATRKDFRINSKHNYKPWQYAFLA